jgi:2-phosphosulfolactate phosphatase
MKVHVLTTKAEINPALLQDKIVVVLDILFATSSIVTAFAHQCLSVVPVRNVTEALALKEQVEFQNHLYSGEINADTLDGFIQPTPIALCNAKIANRHLVYCTTNGTVALNDSKLANKIYVGSLLNTQAIVERLIESHPEQTILIVCSGSNNRFNLEDFYGAGAYVQALAETSIGSDIHFTDSALAAKQVYLSGNAIDILSDARVGKMMIERAWDSETRFAAQHNLYNIIPELHSDGVIRI